MGNGYGEKGEINRGLDKGQLDRLHEYIGVLPVSANGLPQRGRRGFSMSDPNDRPIRIAPPIPLSPQARLKKTMKQKAAEEHFRRNGKSAHSHDALLGDQEEQVHYQTHIFKEALKTALSMQRDGDEGEFGGGMKRPGMGRRGASEGMREGGFVGPDAGLEEVLPKDLAEFLEKYDPRSEDLPDV